jgi:HD superfamily phosphohydrolase
MYKSVYAHHLVCALEKLLEWAIELMCKKGKKLTYGKFRPKTFLEGWMDDIFVLSELRKYQEKYPIFKVFFDRRYLPVALIKHEVDFKKFIRRIKEQAPIDLAWEDVIKKIRTWLEKIEHQPFKEIDNVYYLIPSSKPFSPYKVLGKEDRILIGREGDKPKDLLEISSYVKLLNDEARELGKFFRLSFIRPNCEKESLKKEHDYIYDLVVKEITEFEN